MHGNIVSSYNKITMSHIGPFLCLGNNVIVNNGYLLYILPLPWVATLMCLALMIIYMYFMHQGGSSYTAVNVHGDVVGYGCRRPAMNQDMHGIGPLYADNSSIAEAILQRLCDEIPGQHFYMDMK